MLAGTDNLPDDVRERRRIEAAMGQFEGLIFSTSQIIIRAGVESEHEDVAQVLRVKVWRAIKAYNPEKARGLTLQRYVFMCVSDQKKDLLKKKRRGELHIEDVAPGSVEYADGGDGPRDKFDQRYLSADPDQVYGEIEDDDLLLPNTLTDRERQVLDLMRDSFRQTEIGPILDITKREVEAAVRGIRTKLQDWKPSGDDLGGVVPDHALPQLAEI